MSVGKLFLSYAHDDAPFATQLRAALNDLGVAVWQDVAELSAGADLDVIERAIGECAALAVVVSPASLVSEWVNRELRCAAAVAREKRDFRVIPVLDAGASHADARRLLGFDVVSIPFAGDVGLVAANIRQAIGANPPLPVEVEPRPGAASTADLVIELSRLRIVAGEDGPIEGEVRIRYRGGKQPEVRRGWHRFAPPIGLRQLQELGWYLETYSGWPHGQPANERAVRVVDMLMPLGRALFEATLAKEHDAFGQWMQEAGAQRQVTVEVDADGSPEVAALLSLPWELIARGDHHLCDAPFHASVRRRLPPRDVLSAYDGERRDRPCRVLVVVSRPEQGGVRFLDPRLAVQHIVSSLSAVDGRVQLDFLTEPTYAALEARLEAEPYEIVHFDGHGVYDATNGLAQLAFENDGDVRDMQLRRRADFVPANKLGRLIQRRNVRLFVLAACQTESAHVAATASIAAELMRCGVGSVVTMTHPVLIATAAAWAASFYASLANGSRIGAAMVKARAALRDRAENGCAPPLRDWFVPVLYQHEDGDEPMLDGRRRNAENRERSRAVRLGDLPRPPDHGWIGRAHLLLDVQRTLECQRVVALRGVGGAGKTAIAVELARWLHDTNRFDRIAFVTVEFTAESRAVLHALGRQLVPDFDVERERRIDDDPGWPTRTIQQVLRERRVLLVVDNFESVSDDGRVDGATRSELLELLDELGGIGETRMIVTSREMIPERLRAHRIDVSALEAREGRELTAAVLRKQRVSPSGDWDESAVGRFVAGLGGHARAIVILAPALAELGVDGFRHEFERILDAIDQAEPFNRERSLLASVRLSLARLRPDSCEAVRVLAASSGTAHVGVLAALLEGDAPKARALVEQLGSLGLAELRGECILLDPALPNAIRLGMDPAERAQREASWNVALTWLAGELLCRPPRELASTVDVVRSSLGEFMAALAWFIAARERMSPAEADVAAVFAATVEDLAGFLGRPRLKAGIAEQRRRLVATTTRTSLSLELRYMDIVALSERGDVPRAIDDGRALLEELGPAARRRRELDKLARRVASSVAELLTRSGRAAEALDILETYD